MVKYRSILFVALTVTFIVAGMMSGCSLSGSSSAVQSESAATSSGSSGSEEAPPLSSEPTVWPTDIPSDIPKFQGTIQSVSGKKDNYVVTVQCSDKNAVDSYINTLISGGFTKTFEHTENGQYFATVEKDQYLVQIAFTGSSMIIGLGTPEE